MTAAPNTLNLFLCGDVMTGRGIDQALLHPGASRLYEAYVKDASEYLRLAVKKNGPIDPPLSWDYIWGDALAEWQGRQPDLRIVNLETSITVSDDYWQNKAVNFRMHPGNVACLTAAAIDGCALANNHVLDWGYDGLRETLATLTAAGIQTAGAGASGEEAARPAIWQLDEGRVLLFSGGLPSSGIPAAWKATASRPGINFLEGYSAGMISRIKMQVGSHKRPGDVVLFSIHWGSNWGHDILPACRDFAHRLIDEAGVDIIHGHSSHHFKSMEVYHGKLILYGCGDFINDYEGIIGREAYRSDLRLMYFPVLDFASGKLLSLQMVPLIMRRFRLERVEEADARWVKGLLDRKGAVFGTTFQLMDAGTLQLKW